MDVVRPGRRAHGRGLGVLFTSLLAVAVVVAGVWALPSLLRGMPALPTISRANATIDTARFGPLVRSIRASGTLAPDRIHVVAAASDGIVTALTIRAGSRVEAGTTVAVLENLELDAAVRDARAEVVVAAAQLRTAREEARAAALDRRSVSRAALGEAQTADETFRTDAKLVAAGLVPSHDLVEAKIKNDEAQSIAGIADRKIGVGSADDDAKISIAQASLDRAKATLAASEERTRSLLVRAGASGVVQSVSADVGARMALGAEVARIADESDLKAVLQVAESDMRGIAPGMRVSLEPNGSSPVDGRVARIAPVSVNGSVAVDVTLERVPSSLRPEQNVDGTIELFRMPRALTIARPIDANDNSTIDLFRVAPGGTTAYRTRVRLGAGSPERVSVLSGLAPGSAAIVSDTSAYENDPTIRIITP